MLHPRCTLWCLVVLSLIASSGIAAEVQAILLSPARAWQRAEFRITGAPTAENNFDPEQIRLDATFTTPAGDTLTVPAFWFQDYTRRIEQEVEILTARGTPEWRVRYTPTTPGEHTLTLRVSVAGGEAGTLLQSRFTVSAAEVGSPRGWVRIGSDRRYFATTDGHALRLIGENVCWPRSRGLDDYAEWFHSMQQSGQNFARLWMAPWWGGLEHNPGTLNRYALDAAWRLDQIFALAEAKGLYLLLCFDHHGMYMAHDPAWGGSNNFWVRANPYARENGGPCVSPNAFFTDPQARELYQKRLRYLIARYGGSPRLLAWQFFNEIDNAYIPRSDLVHTDVVAWHRDMARWLRAQDPYQHLITSSLTGGSDRPELWQLPEMEFSMYHSYWDPAPGRKAATLAADFYQRYQKPVMIGEFGVSGANWARPLDPHLRGFRQSLWGGALGGSVGTGMTWWWEDLHDDRVYTLYSALGEILQRAGWHDGPWQPLDVVTPGLPPVTLGQPLPDRATFNATLALNSFRRIALSGEAAIATPLSAERSSEFLSSFLRGQRTHGPQRPLRAQAWFGDSARLVIRVDSVASEAELTIRVDGEERLREKLGSTDAVPTSQSHRIDREFSLSLPGGLRRLEIANEGCDWLNLESVRLEHVQPSHYTDGWQHGPEAVGLQQDRKAILYVHSPWVAHPAGQHRYQAPLLKGEMVQLRRWPAGEFQIEWYRPETGASLGNAKSVSTDGILRFVAPDFDDDLAAIITPVR